MAIALIGAGGQLAAELEELLSDRVVPLAQTELELTDGRQVNEVLTRVAADCVLNAAAYNLVDRAEEEPDVAFDVNALGPRRLAEFCGAHDIPLLHVSSDYVFGLDKDRQTPYRETDAPGPVSAYGLSKLAGEYFVRSLCPRHFVVRTCGLYGHRALTGPGTGNFVETMLRVGREREELRIVCDQHCTPTSTADLAQAIVSLIQTDAYGLYHATNSGQTNWFEFSSEIFRLAGIDVRLTPVTSREYGSKARRPGYSVLDHAKLEQTLATVLPDWHEALARYLATRPE